MNREEKANETLDLNTKDEGKGVAEIKQEHHVEVRRGLEN